MATVTETAAEQRILLAGVRWETYEALVADLESPGVRLTYDRGVLEIMSPSVEHERYGELLGRLVQAMTEELNIPISSCGSTTFRRKDLERGLEPDKCFYVDNEPVVRHKQTLDLSVDPPPDLAIEVQVSRSLLDKLDVYAALQIPEIWTYDGDTLRALTLDASGGYQPQEQSPSFPFLPLNEVVRFLKLRETLHETQLARSFREWVRESLSSYRQDG